ncbi:hypothetical protein PIB30_042826 [Stylosanthes scabra]|uniref:Uncharacterized protein n=1 Tax=Stylosanthes scabra TaxID=79078 RepID=A0ABU6VEW2_9FABA|nr:hypothetical protein [Stylosanthes scabra]
MITYVMPLLWLWCYMHNKERTVVKPHPVKRVSDDVGSRMGTGVIFYEELADDMYETWDIFDTIFKDKLRIRAYPSAEPFHYPVQSMHFDPDFPYDYPISSMRPDGGILHPSPPPQPYYSPPRDPTFP